MSQGAYLEGHIVGVDGTTASATIHINGQDGHPAVHVVFEVSQIV